jgi:type IV secretory pathway TraG/TraD family ATPase VirD4
VNRTATFALLVFVAPLGAIALHYHSTPATLCCGIVVLWLFACLIRPASDGGATKRGRIVLGPLSWTIDDFMRHWLIVGRSGCGKTISAVKRLMIAFYRTQPDGGGLVTDEKGDFAFMVTRIFAAIGQAEKVLLLRAPPPAEHETHPAVAMNLIGDRRISWSTYASIVVDVAISQGQKTSQAFFKTQARDRIEDTFHTLEAAGVPVTLVNAYEFFKTEQYRGVVVGKLDARRQELESTFQELRRNNRSIESVLVKTHQRIETLLTVWKEFATKAGEEASGIRSTAENYLRPYAERGLAHTFSAHSRSDLVTFEAMDAGRLIVPTVPQAYTGRRYIMAFCKVLFYQHGLLRFDQFGESVGRAPPLVLWADEGQNTLLPTEGGLSDINSLDKLRAARCTVVFAMQDFVSAIPAIDGQDKADVLFTNLNNQLLFSLNSSKGRTIASEQIGEEEQWETTHSRGAGKEGPSVSRVKRMKPVYPPTYFRKLRRFQCVMLHAEGRHVTATLPPINDDGAGVPSWYFWSNLKETLTGW